MEKLEFIVLAENTSPRGELLAEHGFSALLRRGEQSLLFDCGDSGIFIDNADALDIDLRGTDAIALSHNHYDHTRGFLRFMREYSHDYTLYLARRFFKTGYWNDEHEPGLIKPTSGPLSHEGLMAGGVNFRLVEPPLFELPQLPGVFLLGDVARVTAFEQPDPSDFVELPDGSAQTDLYHDEQVVVAKTGGGLVVISGCSHVGVVNILEQVRRLFPGERIAAFFGGTHLVAADGERIEQTMRYLKTQQIPLVGVCHCTGEAGFLAAQHAGFSRINTGYKAAFE